MKVLDSHHHDGNLALSLGVNREVDYPDPWATFSEEEYQERLRIMDSADIDTAVLMPVNRYIMANGIADTRRVNNAVARYRDHDSARFVAALGVAEPLHGPSSLDEIRRMRAELGLVGVSYHARWQGVTTSDPWILRQLELLQELRMIPCVHAHAESNLESPSMVGQLARSFPDLPILVTDALSTRTNTMHFLDVAARFSNIYLETSLLYSAAALQDIVGELGPDRVVFGSDTYSRRMLTRNTPKVISGLGFAEDALDKILQGNMSRLLAWAGSPLSARLASSWSDNLALAGQAAAAGGGLCRRLRVACEVSWLRWRAPRCGWLDGDLPAEAFEAADVVPGPAAPPRPDDQAALLPFRGS